METPWRNCARTGQKIVAWKLGLSRKFPCLLSIGQHFSFNFSEVPRSWESLFICAWDGGRNKEFY